VSTRDAEQCGEELIMSEIYELLKATQKRLRPRIRALPPSLEFPPLIPFNLIGLISHSPSAYRLHYMELSRRKRFLHFTGKSFGPSAAFSPVSSKNAEEITKINLSGVIDRSEMKFIGRDASQKVP
jgi:hypothetical protein